MIAMNQVLIFQNHAGTGPDKRSRLLLVGTLNSLSSVAGRSVRHTSYVNVKLYPHGVVVDGRP